MRNVDLVEDKKRFSVKINKLPQLVEIIVEDFDVNAPQVVSRGVSINITKTIFKKLLINEQI